MEHGKFKNILSMENPFDKNNYLIPANIGSFDIYISLSENTITNVVK